MPDSHVLGILLTVFMSWETQHRAACIQKGEHTTLTACNDIIVGKFLPDLHTKGVGEPSLLYFVGILSCMTVQSLLLVALERMDATLWKYRR